MRYSLVTAPSIEPVTLTEAKAHLRVETTADDTLLTSLIKSSRQMAEAYTGITFIDTTWKLFIDNWPSTYNKAWGSGVRELPIDYDNKRSYIEIPLSPLQSVTHIKTYDNADASTTIASTEYQVSTYAGITPKKGRITLRDGATWPTFERNADGIEIQLVSGYGTATTDVPETIRQALLIDIAFRYENRGDGSISGNAKQLLNQFRTISL
tara:strand:+ start:450 stop:1079 length:630 start_codon:yes stop_codon:yes gene_type:complete